MVTAEECWHKSLTPLMEQVRQRIGHGPVYLSYDIVRPPKPPSEPSVAVVTNMGKGETHWIWAAGEAKLATSRRVGTRTRPLQAPFRISEKRYAVVACCQDSLDPAFAPGTGTLEVGGLTVWQGLEIIRGMVRATSPVIIG